MNSTQKQAGFTLIELMIAIVLALLVTGAIITVFVTNVKSSAENIKMVRLNQELRVAMSFMSDELKRAGYSAAADAGYINALSLTDQDLDGNDDCIIYAYDANGDSSAYSSPGDNFGFKLSGQTLYWGTSVTDCSSGSWNNPITDSSIAAITDFTITDRTASSAVATNVFIPGFDISITGETQLNPDTASRTITETIRVRNDDAD